MNSQLCVDCVADEHEPWVVDNRNAALFDSKGKMYLVCGHCAALWDGESWIE